MGCPSCGSEFCDGEKCSEDGGQIYPYQDDDVDDDDNALDDDDEG